MKILITGFTTRHTGSTRLLYEYIKCADVLVEGFAAAGHQADVRQVQIDEADDYATSYDVALVGVCPPTSMGARFVLGALETLRAFGPRAALWADDWSLTQLRSQINTAIRHPNQRLLAVPSATNPKPLSNKVGVERGRELGAAHWTAQLQDLLTNTDRKILLWFFGTWGDPVRFMRDIIPAKPVMYDPSLFMAKRPHLMVGAKPGEFTLPAADGPKFRGWVHATLQKHEDWLAKLNLKWPVIGVGNKRQDQEVVTERQVMQMYATNWGVLCPRYPKPGLGWWRVRYLQSALMDNVLLGSVDDAGTFGDGYRLWPRDVELASDDQLLDFAARQRATYFSKTWTEDRFIQALDSFVTGLSS